MLAAELCIWRRPNLVSNGLVRDFDVAVAVCTASCHGDTLHARFAGQEKKKGGIVYRDLASSEYTVAYKLAG